VNVIAIYRNRGCDETKSQEFRFFTFNVSPAYSYQSAFSFATIWIQPFFQANLFDPDAERRSNGNVPHPDQKGWLGKMVVTQAKRAYNALPKECKECNDIKKAKLTIQKLIKVNHS